MKALGFVVASFITLPVMAQWQLNNDESVLNFISVKKNTVAEVHHFKNLSGEIKPTGDVSFAIDLASVETNIAIRNERMQEHLFNTNKFSQAIFSGKVDTNLLKQLAVGESKTISLSGSLDLHGLSQSVTTKVNVVKLKSNAVLVTSLSPIIINAGDFNLIEGINKLQSLAGLPSIDLAVPVSFNLVFTKQ